MYYKLKFLRGQKFFFLSLNSHTKNVFYHHPFKFLNRKKKQKVSNALGSNIFDICIGLGIPLFFHTLIFGESFMIPTSVKKKNKISWGGRWCFFVNAVRVCVCFVLFLFRESWLTLSLSLSLSCLFFVCGCLHPSW